VVTLVALLRELVVEGVAAIGCEEERRRGRGRRGELSQELGMGLENEHEVVAGWKSC
jgi:hypothetical protein